MAWEYGPNSETVAIPDPEALHCPREWRGSHGEEVGVGRGSWRGAKGWESLCYLLTQAAAGGVVVGAAPGTPCWAKGMSGPGTGWCLKRGA
eukprot:1158532-Pelagomonas_calceolata.AAC.2